MIIYGTGSKHLKTEQPKGTSCPLCKADDSILMSVFSRHAHIFWIPLFPIGKVVGSQCQNCQEVLDNKNVSSQIKDTYKELKKDTTIPIWQFVGLFLILIGVAFFSYSSYQNEQNKLAYLATPQKEDIYTHEIKAGDYTTFKIVEVSEDSIFVSMNEYGVNLPSGVASIEKEENYSEIVYGMAKKDVLKMNQEGEIYEIERK